MTDVIIIGAGIAGMTSAIISSCGGLSVRLIDKNGFAVSANEAPHFSSLSVFNGFTPQSLCEIFVMDITKCGIEVTRGKAISVSKDGDYFRVNCDVGDYFSYSVIIAAGKHHGIFCPASEYNHQIDEGCRASPAGLMLCGSARRGAGVLRCMADGLVCGETAAEWVRSKFYT